MMAVPIASAIQRFSSEGVAVDGASAGDLTASHSAGGRVAAYRLMDEPPHSRAARRGVSMRLAAIMARAAIPIADFRCNDSNFNLSGCPTAWCLPALPPAHGFDSAHHFDIIVAHIA